MTATIVVLMVWLGGSRDDPMAIPGFQSMAACERAASEIKVAASWTDRVLGPYPLTRCMEFER